MDFGAKGDGKWNDTDAIRATFAACAQVWRRYGMNILNVVQAGGGTVVFPNGKYLTAPFNVTSFTTVQACRSFLEMLLIQMECLQSFVYFLSSSVLISLVRERISHSWYSTTRCISSNSPITLLWSRQRES